jgi:integrase
MTEINGIKQVNATDFIRLKYTKENTISLYENCICLFLGTIYPELLTKKYCSSQQKWFETTEEFCPECHRRLKQKLPTETMIDYANKYFAETRDWETDIENFLAYLNKRSMAPKTIQSYISIIRVFLRRNKIKRIEPSKSFFEDLNLHGDNVLTLDRPPTNEELRLMLSDMPINGKALFLLLSSSGMRVGEALKLKITDFNFDLTPTKIAISGKYTKTGQSRYAFCSHESTELLSQWLKQRDSYLKTAVSRSKYPKVDDGRMFPFQANIAATLFWNGLNRASKVKPTLLERDAATGRFRIHIHTLRKFFRTRLGMVIPVDVVESLMGHSGYLTSNYRKPSDEELVKAYLEGEHVLEIFTQNTEVARLRAEIEEKNKQLRNIVDGIVSEQYENKAWRKKMESKLKRG